MGLRDPRETARLLGALDVAELAPVVSILAAADPTDESTREAFLAVFRTATPEMVSALAAALDTDGPPTRRNDDFRETARIITNSYPDDPERARGAHAEPHPP